MGDELISAIDSTMEHLNQYDGYRPPIDYASGSSKTDNYEQVSLKQQLKSSCDSCKFLFYEKQS